MRKGFVALPLLLLVPLAAKAQVPGSYQRSCTNISQNGPILSAVCRGTDGQYYQTSLNLAQCGGSGVANSRGRLVCGGPRPQGYFPPPPPRYDPNGGGYPPPGYRPPPRPRYYGADPRDGGYRPPPPRPGYDPDPDQ